MIRLMALLLACGVLVACSSHPAADSAAADSASPAAAATNALAGTPMAAYGQALDKARNVQHVVNEQARKQAKAIAAQTR